MTRGLNLILALALIAGCACGSRAAGTNETATRLTAPLLERALAVAERPGRRAILVIPQALEADLGPVAREVRETVSEGRVPRNERYSLPEGYVVVRSAQVEGDRAVVELLVGPVPVAKEGEAQLDCGTTYRVHFKKDPGTGEWVDDVVSASKC